MSFVTNEEKIEKIISKYEDSGYKYVEDLYEEIMFIKHNRYYLNVDEENINSDMKFVKMYNLDEELSDLKNYKFFEINNEYSYGFARFDFFKKDVTNWNIISQNVAYNGGKFYIDMPFTKIITLDQKEYREFYKKLDNDKKIVEFKNMKLSYFTKPFYENDIEYFDLVVNDRNQILLTTNFVKDFFYELDKENFVDVIAFKYFPSNLLRKDKLNFYVSKKVVNSDELLEKFAKVLKKLVKKYQKLGLKFNSNHFIMPYDFDREERIIANVYVSESFNKSLAFFILLYMNPAIDILHNLHYYNYTSNCYLRSITEKDLDFVKECQQKYQFKDFVREIYYYFNECNYKYYIKTYNRLFKE